MIYVGCRYAKFTRRKRLNMEENFLCLSSCRGVLDEPICEDNEASCGVHNSHAACNENRGAPVCPDRQCQTASDAVLRCIQESFDCCCAGRNYPTVCSRFSLHFFVVWQSTRSGQVVSGARLVRQRIQSTMFEAAVEAIEIGSLKRKLQCFQGREGFLPPHKCSVPLSPHHHQHGLCTREGQGATQKISLPSWLGKSSS
jgi:hypothetical protein